MALEASDITELYKNARKQKLQKVPQDLATSAQKTAIDGRAFLSRNLPICP